MTAVGKVLRSPDHLGPNRVQMNVPHQLRQILITLTEYRLVTTLEQVARLSVLPIVILAIGGQEPLHHPTDRVILSFDKQVDVVWHQAVGIEVERELRFLLGELREESAVVVIRSEDELPIVASSDDVVEPTLDFEPRLAHCGRSLP